MARRATPTCPSCGEVGPELPRDACVIEALLQVVIDRGVISRAQAQRALPTLDADDLWRQIGPVVDRIEDALVGGRPRRRRGTHAG